MHIYSCCSSCLFLALESSSMIDQDLIFGIVTRFYKLQRCDAQHRRHLLVPGDLIEYVRGAFSHWAVYLGNNQIVHLPGPSNIFANFQVGSRCCSSGPIPGHSRLDLPNGVATDLGSLH